MKKVYRFLTVFILAFIVVISSCTKDTTDPIAPESIDGLDVSILRLAHHNSNILLFISVTDLSGNVLKSLQSGNVKIQIMEDNNTTDIDEFNFLEGGHSYPIATALTLDYSGSMHEDSTTIPAMENAVKAFINLKASWDRCEIIKFDDQVKRIQGFTQNNNLLLNAVDDNTYPFQGSTAFYRACIQGIIDADSLFQALNLSTLIPAVIGFTDGVNNQAPLDPDSLIDVALQYQVPIYTIGFGGSISTIPDTATLRAISDSTGGRFYWTPNATELLQLYQYINGQLAYPFLAVFPWNPPPPGPNPTKSTARIRVTVNYLGHTAKAERKLWY